MYIYIYTCIYIYKYIIIMIIIIYIYNIHIPFKGYRALIASFPPKNQPLGYSWDFGHFRACSTYNLGFRV